MKKLSSENDIPLLPVLRTGPRFQHKLGKHANIELYPQALSLIFSIYLLACV